MALAGVVIEPPLMSLVERDCSASAVGTALMPISVEKSDVISTLGLPIVSLSGLGCTLEPLALH